MDAKATFGSISTDAREGAQLIDQPYRNNFDYIRLFAATQVVIFHGIYHLGLGAPAWTSLFNPFSGVPIFFVVSGFLITASYERSSSLRSYIEKRARRLLPGLWLCIIVTSLVVFVLGYPLVSPKGAVWFFSQLAALIYTPDFLRSFGFGSYNGSLWTIPVEIQFYATVPILAALVRRVSDRRWLLVPLLVAAAMAATLIRIFVPSVTGMFEGTEDILPKIIKYLFVSHYFQFLLGATAFYLSWQNSPWVRGKAVLWLMPVLLVHFLVPFSATTVVVGQLLLGVLTLSAAFTAARGNWLGGVDMSYGIYLFHGLVLNLLVVGGWVNTPAALYVLLLGAYAAGWLSWTLIESRFLHRVHSHRSSLSSR